MLDAETHYQASARKGRSDLPPCHEVDMVELNYGARVARACSGRTFGPGRNNVHCSMDSQGDLRVIAGLSHEGVYDVMSLSVRAMLEDRIDIFKSPSGVCVCFNHPCLCRHHARPVDPCIAERSDALPAPRGSRGRTGRGLYDRVPCV